MQKIATFFSALRQSTAGSAGRRRRVRPLRAAAVRANQRDALAPPDTMFTRHPQPLHDSARGLKSTRFAVKCTQSC
jgi:hypothetical protein